DATRPLSWSHARGEPGAPRAGEPDAAFRCVRRAAAYVRTGRPAGRRAGGRPARAGHRSRRPHRPHPSQLARVHRQRLCRGQAGRGDRAAEPALHAAGAAVRAAPLRVGGRGHGRKLGRHRLPGALRAVPGRAPRPSVRAVGGQGRPLVRRPHPPVRRPGVQRRGAALSAVGGPGRGAVRHRLHLGHHGQAQGGGAHAREPDVQRRHHGRGHRTDGRRRGVRGQHALQRVRHRHRGAGHHGGGRLAGAGRGAVARRGAGGGGARGGDGHPRRAHQLHPGAQRAHPGLAQPFVAAHRHRGRRAGNGRAGPAHHARPGAGNTRGIRDDGNRQHGVRQHARRPARQAGGHRGPPAGRDRGAGDRCRRLGSSGGVGGRGRHQGAGRHAGLLPAARRDGPGVHARRLFPDRRPGDGGRGGLRSPDRPPQGNDHPRRVQRVPARGGGPAARAPRGARRGGGGPSRRDPGRKGMRLHRPRRGRHRNGRGDPRFLPRGAGGLQGSRPRALPGRLSPDGKRQGAPGGARADDQRRGEQPAV
ncbi:MAG: Long-chain-fatty-acid--CoA ligase, partial [uncultured Gemmatimonadetes bacterium]